MAEAEANRPFSAYVHIPFCDVRCGYCDFNTYVADFGGGASRATYHETLLKEVELSTQVLSEVRLDGRPIQSLFFGGGTPSLLEAESIAAVVDSLEAAYGLVDGVEVTLEANPDTITGPEIAQFRDAGVTRVSIGTQSFVPHVLKTLDRTHDPESVAQAVEGSKQAGVQVSLDLIYGTPGESLSDWERSVSSALSLNPDHLSAYSLIIEDGTKMGQALKRGQIPPSDLDLEADKYLLVSEMAASAGLGWYEISNFASSPQARSVHNQAYWKDWDWWGFGAGAHSHVGRARWWNVLHPTAYAGRLATGSSPAGAGERLTGEDRALERIMLAIRTIEGVTGEGVAAHAVAAGEVATYEDAARLGLRRIGRLVESGHLEEAASPGRYVLTMRGRLLADYVTRVLLGWE